MYDTILILVHESIRSGLPKCFYRRHALGLNAAQIVRLHHYLPAPVFDVAHCWVPTFSKLRPYDCAFETDFEGIRPGDDIVIRIFRVVIMDDLIENMMFV